jgi:hypothetical protein
MKQIKIMSLGFLVFFVFSVAIGAFTSYVSDGMPFHFKAPFIQLGTALVTSTVGGSIVIMAFIITKIDQLSKKR